MSLGPNQGLMGEPPGVIERQLHTPALTIDLDLFEANLQTMASLARQAGRALLPHAKAHKSIEIARRQLAAGAAGICCATVREAEVMAGAGLDGILLTTPVVTPSMLARVVDAAARVREFTVVVDSMTGVEALAAASRVPIGVLIDIDMGTGRTGLTSVDEAVAIARRIGEVPQLRYRGVQAYYGGLQHVRTSADRGAKAREQWAKLATFIDALTAAGAPPERISGGGTGTHYWDLQGPFTEIQPGSYLFMDKQYGEVEIHPDAQPFALSLTVAARVVSAVQPRQIIVDAGTKALSTDYGPALVVRPPAGGATYRFMGDEHGAVVFDDETRKPELGALLHLVTPHCDPTVNLHNRFHVMRDGRLVDIWPIDARGY